MHCDLTLSTDLDLTVFIVIHQNGSKGKSISLHPSTQEVHFQTPS